MLRAELLGHAFGALQVTRNVSLDVPAGTRHAIIGPNGAGKTTLFNLLAGEIRPQSGRILLGERDVTRLAPHRRARLGLSRSFQRNNVFTGLTVHENLMLAYLAKTGRARVFWRRAAREQRALDEVARVADQVGLAETLARPVGELSYGAVRQTQYIADHMRQSAIGTG